MRGAEGLLAPSTWSVSASRLRDVKAMLDAGLVSPDGLRAAFERAAPALYRYPAVDPDTYRRALDAVLQADGPRDTGSA